MKIAIDTNILIRLIVLDDESYVKKASDLILSHDYKEIHVCCGAMIEAYYVLTKRYGLSADEARKAFIDLLGIEQFNFEYEDSIRLALAKSTKGLSFFDALIGEIGATKHIKTYTFDKDLKSDKNFVVLR